MPGVVNRPAKHPLFRRRVPADLAHRFICAEIVRSLGTGSAADIRRRASNARALTEMLFMKVRADPRLTAADIRALTDAYLTDLDRLDRRDRETLPFALTPAGGDRKAQIRHHERVAAGAVDRQFEVGGILDPQAVCRIARDVGIEIDVGSPLEAEINEALSRAFVRFHAERAERLRQDAHVGDRGLIDRGLKAVGLRRRPLPEVSPKFSGNREQMPSPTIEPNPSPQPAQTTPPVSNEIATNLTSALATLNDRLADLAPRAVSGIAMSSPSVGPAVRATAPVEALWNKFITFKIDGSKDWKASRRPELSATISLWKWLGEPNTIDGYGLRDAARLRETYMALPADYDEIRASIAAQRKHRRAEKEGRQPGRADRKKITLESVMAHDRKREPATQRVNPKTWNKHRTNIKAFFDWLIATGEFEGPNPFATLHVRIKKRGRRGRNERDAYSLEQIEKIFRMPLFQGCESRKYRSAPGTVVIRDALFWAPLIAAYHGMRREEISQLKVRHIRQETGIWVFDLEADDLKLKGVDDGSGSERLVPLHADFIATGFLEDMVLGRPAGERLFIELNDDNAHGAFGVTLGRKLRYLFQNSGIFAVGEEVGLHRFRHAFSTQLENTDAKSSFVDALTGHASEQSDSERQRYTKGIFVENLKKTIDLLRLPISLPPRADTDLKAEIERPRKRQRSNSRK